MCKNLMVFQPPALEQHWSQNMQCELQLVMHNASAKTALAVVENTKAVASTRIRQIKWQLLFLSPN